MQRLHLEPGSGSWGHWSWSTQLPWAADRESARAPAFLISSRPSSSQPGGGGGGLSHPDVASTQSPLGSQGIICAESRP